jgi:acyl carrier protein
MTRDEILRAVTAHLREELPPEERAAPLTDGTALMTGGLLDSSGTLALVAFLEQRFGCKLAAYEMDVEYLDTPARIADLVLSKLRPGQAGPSQ